jgi:hypothetical protein
MSLASPFNGWLARPSVLIDILLTGLAHAVRSLETEVQVSRSAAAYSDETLLYSDWSSSIVRSTE